MNGPFHYNAFEMSAVFVLVFFKVPSTKHIDVVLIVLSCQINIMDDTSTDLHGHHRPRLEWLEYLVASMIVFFPSHQEAQRKWEHRS